VGDEAASEPTPLRTTPGHVPERAASAIRVPDGVIGRQTVIAELERNLAAVSESGRRFVVIEGEAGTGKSLVLREMRRRVATAGGIAAGGEFGARERRRPSSGLRGVVGDIVATMLTLSESEVRDWLFELRQALGGPIEQFADVVPELALLSNREAIAPAPSPTATGLRNRLRLAVMAVVRTAARPARPLLVTLDNFDAAGGESMQIVHDVVTSDADGLLVIAATEPGALEGLPVLDDPAAERIRVEAFDRDGLQQFVAAALGVPSEAVAELAPIVERRAGTNPLSVLQFLQRAAAAGVLNGPDAHGAWTWDGAAMHAVDRTPSGEDIALAVLAEVDDPRVLEVAACLGESFTIQDLSIAAGRAFDEVAETILHALDRGILRRRATHDTSGVFLDSRDAYVFVTGRVEEAVRAQVSREGQAEVHRRFGEALLRSDRDDDVIGAARHLNATFSWLTSSSDRMELAALNQRAARRARQTAAFPLALELAESGITCLPPDADDLDHVLVLDLHLLAAEAAWITGSFTTMHGHIDAARTLHTTVLDRAELAFLEVRALSSAERQAEAIATGRTALAELGVRLPAKPRTRHVLQELPRVRRRLRGRSDEELLMLPKATDAETLAAQKLLAEMFGPAYMAEPDLWPLLALRCLHLTLTGGRAGISPVAFAGYGLLLGILGRYESARRFGDLALTMAEHPDCREFGPWAKFLYYDFIHDWTQPAADAIEPLRDAIREALLIGDLENAGFMAVVELSKSVSYGVALPEIDARGAELAVYLRPYGAQFTLAESTRQLVQNLMGRAPDPFELVGDTGYDERVALPAAIERGDVTGISTYHITKMGLHFLYGDFGGAIEHATESERCLAGMRGTNNVPIFHMTNAIVRLRTAPGKQSTRRAVRHARRGYRTWRRICPQNYESSWLLVEAEIARAAGNTRRAHDLYDQTITAADRSGQVTTAALAREYCGDLHAREGRERVASAYLNAAVDAWVMLGADGKVEKLLGDFSGLLRPLSSDRADAGSRALLELTDGIMTEPRLGHAAERLLAGIVTFTGAQRAALFTNDGTNLVPAAAFQHGAVTSASSASDIGYAASVVRYVEHNDRPVLIPDTAASVHGRDQHLHATRTRSVLCTPITRGGVQRALVYLEHGDPSAFTLAHVENLRMLSAHIATALENEQLTEQLEQALQTQRDLRFAQARFIPDELLRELGRETLVTAEAGDAVAREMTLLYTDIRGYTPIQEELDPRHGIEFLNNYLRRMEPAIVAHGGFVNSYMGDGMIAAFEPAADGALRAALAMRRIEREVAEERLARGLEPVRTGIAVHTGKVVIATFGGVNQLRCGVVGDTVNVASRLEGLTRDHAPLLLSDTAYAALADPSAYDLRRVGRFRVVGRRAPVTAWEAFDEDESEIRSAKRASMATHDAALAAFEAGQFDDARAAFEAVARAVPGDRIAAVYLARCAAVAERGAPANWDGVITLDRK
jgi:predicted ATPase/class 3 adenylate cyclase